MQKIICVIGPTASGKSAKAVALAKERNGEVISVDSRQVYRTLDIGTEKTSPEEMQGIPHHLIDIREPEEIYTAGDFVEDATRLIDEIAKRGRVPILCGGTHFYFDALINGLPVNAPKDAALRAALEEKDTNTLFNELERKDLARAQNIEPNNKRRIIRALELIYTLGKTPVRERKYMYDVEWVVVDVKKEELRERIDTRLRQALARGLIEEVVRVRARVHDARLHELGLEYRTIGEYLRGERTEETLFPTLSSKLWRFAKTQKRWIKKLV